MKMSEPTHITQFNVVCSTQGGGTENSLALSSTTITIVLAFINAP